MNNFFRAGQRAALFFVTILMSVSFSALTQAANPSWKESNDDTVYPIVVYRSTTCGCCKAWVDHLKDHNFKVKEVTDSEMNAVKKAFGVPQNLASCHTATIGGKLIEGHVPAQDIKRMLETDNDIRLLTVPGMVSGSPGMDMEGADKQDFRVYAVTNDGDESVFSTYDDY